MMKENNKFKVKTPHGYSDFDYIQKTEKDEYLKITLDNGYILKCSLEHPFKIGGEKVPAENLEVGTFLEGEETPFVKINDIQHIREHIVLYDLINVHENHEFYVNGILSSNCDAEFLSSGNSVVDARMLKWYSEYTVQKPIEKRYNERLWIWKYCENNHSYMVCADVARGDGTDFSAFHVIDVDTLEQIAEFKGKINTKDYGNMLTNIANEYNQALLVVENANIGWAVLQTIIDKKYTNLYYTDKDYQYIDMKKYLNKGYDITNINKNHVVPGFTTSKKTRPLIIEKLELLCADKNEPLKIRSKRLIDELFVFSWNNRGRAEAQSGYNDDLVMSFAIALWIRDTAIKLRQEGLKLTKKLIKSTKQVKFKGSKGDRTYNPGKQAWQYQDNTTENWDLRELL